MSTIQIQLHGDNSNTHSRSHPACKAAQSKNPSNLITITNNNRLRKNGHVNFYSSVYNNACGTPVANTLRQISLYCLKARSLKSKSAAFVDLVCDIKADIFTICETWLTINDSAVLNDLRPPGYKLYLYSKLDLKHISLESIMIK